MFSLLTVAIIVVKVLPSKSSAEFRDNDTNYIYYLLFSIHTTVFKMFLERLQW